ncbi:MAG: ketose-bisphosphate aldolase [Gammaproteobacteria bacterium]|nr:ketose-bisphosphate aldolase [Gammaproteobacteria bacterium]
MPLVNIKDMLEHAYQHSYAVGAFDLVSLDFLEGVIKAAEQARAPVILSLSESQFEHYDFELLLSAVESASKRALVPVAIHLDHGTTLDSAIHAINHGCNSVMIDASRMPIHENISISNEMVKIAHSCGISVEGELGYVPETQDVNNEHQSDDIVYTTPMEAKAYVERTDIDFLAVSIGTKYGYMKNKPKLDYQRLKQINDAVGIPLVLHGSNGLSDDQFRRLIANGVAKINYDISVTNLVGNQIKENCKENKITSDYRALFNNVRDVIAAEAERCMYLWGSAGRAAEVLAQCRHWTPIEHLIIYNVEGLNKEKADAMMADGRRELSTIPGVREVFVGEAIKDDAKFRYTWLVRFCHVDVIDSYREHPVHVNFADNRFRPVAGERISIDYSELAYEE